MTQDEIIRSPLGREQLVALAREAGVSIRGYYDETGSTPQELERFAALVAAHASADEREACAKVCDVEIVGDEYTTALINSYADTIRARSEK